MACIPVPDAALCERMSACVVLRERQTLTFDDLIPFLIGKEIAKVNVPDRLVILSDLPLSTFGKVSKKRLVEMVAA